MSLPDLDAFHFIRSMRGAVPDAVLVALTSHGREDDQRRAREAGFHSHLLKPVNPDQLLYFLAGLSLRQLPP
jgi:DNA-binding response OmpR family regulator